MISTDEFKVSWVLILFFSVWFTVLTCAFFLSDELQEAVRMTCIGKKYGEFPQVSWILFFVFNCTVWNYNFTGFVRWAQPRATNENKKWAFVGSSSLISRDFWCFFLCTTSLVKSGLVWPRPRHNRTRDLTLALLCLISTMLIKLESFAYSQEEDLRRRQEEKNHSKMKEKDSHRSLGTWHMLTMCLNTTEIISYNKTRRDQAKSHCSQHSNPWLSGKTIRDTFECGEVLSRA